MKRFIGTKEILAEPMTRQQYNDYRELEMPPEENGADEGYLVEYLNGGKPNHPDHKGYISWSPKDVFKRSYRRADTPKDRALIEAEDLKGRIVKLDDYLFSDNDGQGSFKKMPLRDQDLLMHQRQLMAAYLEVLITRLKESFPD